MRLLIAAALLPFVPMNTIAEPQVDSFTCKPWSNGGLRMRGDVQLELSGLNLLWTNGKNTQTGIMMNPEDKLEGTVSEATRIYVAEDRTAVYFLKKYPSPDNQLNINRTIVSVRGSKQSTTKCHPLD